MKRQIRKSCFETNSSSTHALCITKEPVDKSTFPDHVVFAHGEFGWESEEYFSLYSKASYLYQAICDCFEGEKREEKLNTLASLLGEEGISCEFESAKVNSWGWEEGYIDHAHDTEEFIDAVLADSDKLFRYLFGDSFIVTGNDNGDDYRDRMYVKEGEEVTKWGTWPLYGGMKPEFDNYEVYEKWN